MALGSVGSAWAWQQKPATQPSQSTAANTAANDASERYKQAVKQQQLNDQLQKNHLENQLQQHSQNTALAPSAKNPLLRQQFDDADRAREQRYRAGQQDLLDRYKNAVAPRVAPPLPQPANPPPVQEQ
ncbi:hypothetical protein DVJ77_01975 [Dyella tabacisoli]|uniref:Uncharacterized protein n=2 Tax=Dyella tabacisoli TaxID=2282381 RepID=A0A369URI8_9GAMM|nr:hypothetical protein DVJ77_01975 [Dyella tabacisoli]